ncbi:hypothetical protein NDU88_003005 [Pleurodeles waltl]|uniref:Uncharacterized protein n=1 Tax=Pleurodeles waltl TaxID=8319 RepID=A0AAV7T467_PLEWA|nr:hypothetical protein NDU88_003005 [Pleurodeles waltl]
MGMTAPWLEHFIDAMLEGKWSGKQSKNCRSSKVKRPWNTDKLESMRVRNKLVTYAENKVVLQWRPKTPD